MFCCLITRLKYNNTKSYLIYVNLNFFIKVYAKLKSVFSSNKEENNERRMITNDNKKLDEN